MKPVIGIVAKPGYKVDEDIWYRMDIVDEIRYLIIQNGGIAINIFSEKDVVRHRLVQDIVRAYEAYNEKKK